MRSNNNNEFAQNNIENDIKNIIKSFITTDPVSNLAVLKAFALHFQNEMAKINETNHSPDSEKYLNFVKYIEESTENHELAMEPVVENIQLSHDVAMNMQETADTTVFASPTNEMAINLEETRDITIPAITDAKTAAIQILLNHLREYPDALNDFKKLGSLLKECPIDINDGKNSEKLFFNKDTISKILHIFVKHKLKCNLNKIGIRTISKGHIIIQNISDYLFFIKTLEIITDDQIIATREPHALSSNFTPAPFEPTIDVNNNNQNDGDPALTISSEMNANLNTGNSNKRKAPDNNSEEDNQPQAGAGSKKRKTKKPKTFAEAIKAKNKPKEKKRTEKPTTLLLLLSYIVQYSDALNDIHTFAALLTALQPSPFRGEYNRTINAEHHVILSLYQTTQKFGLKFHTNQFGIRGIDTINNKIILDDPNGYLFVTTILNQIVSNQFASTNNTQLSSVVPTPAPIQPVFEGIDLSTLDILPPEVQQEMVNAFSMLPNPTSHPNLSSFTDAELSRIFEIEKDDRTFETHENIWGILHSNTAQEHYGETIAQHHNQEDVLVPPVSAFNIHPTSTTTTTTTTTTSTTTSQPRVRNANNWVYVDNPIERVPENLLETSRKKNGARTANGMRIAREVKRFEYVNAATGDVIEEANSINIQRKGPMGTYFEDTKVLMCKEYRAQQIKMSGNKQLEVNQLPLQNTATAISKTANNDVEWIETNAQEIAEQEPPLSADIPPVEMQYEMSQNSPFEQSLNLNETIPHPSPEELLLLTPGTFNIPLEAATPSTSTTTITKTASITTLRPRVRHANNWVYSDNPSELVPSNLLPPGAPQNLHVKGRRIKREVGPSEYVYADTGYVVEDFNSNEIERTRAGSFFRGKQVTRCDTFRQKIKDAAESKAIQKSNKPPFPHTPASSTTTANDVEWIETNVQVIAQQEQISSADIRHGETPSIEQTLNHNETIPHPNPEDLLLLTPGTFNIPLEAATPSTSTTTTTTTSTTTSQPRVRNANNWVYVNNPSELVPAHLLLEIAKKNYTINGRQIKREVEPKEYVNAATGDIVEGCNGKNIERGGRGRGSMYKGIHVIRRDEYIKKQNGSGTLAKKTEKGNKTSAPNLPPQTIAPATNNVEGMEANQEESGLQYQPLSGFTPNSANNPESFTPNSANNLVIFSPSISSLLGNSMFSPLRTPNPAEEKEKNTNDLNKSL